MSRNRFLMLVAVTLAAVILVVMLERPDERGGDQLPETAMPGLDEVVNEVAAIDIVAPGGELAVRLRRDDERWRVPEKDGYEAEFARVIEFLRTLAGAGVVEPKTTKPDWYSQLGVQDVDAPDATGRRIDFPDRDLPSIIIGQADPSGEGSYARLAGQERSWLLDEIVEVPIDPVTWLEPGIMDIPASDIEEVVIRHADGEVVRLTAAGDGDQRVFVLRDVPEGREAGPEWKRNAIGNGLRGLNLEDVRRFDPPAPDDATRVLLTTTDGLNFVVELFVQDDAHWAHFNVSAENPADAPEPGTDGDRAAADPEGDDDAADDSGNGEGDSNRRLADATAVDERLSPWLYAIPESRYDDLTRRIGDLLAPIEDEDGEES